MKTIRELNNSISKDKIEEKLNEILQEFDGRTFDDEKQRYTQCDVALFQRKAMRMVLEELLGGK